MENSKNNLSRGVRIWLRLMEIGRRAGCHQMEERSFSFRGYQFPVCARCTGVLLGQLLAIPLLIIGIRFSWWALAGLVGQFAAFDTMTAGGMNTWLALGEILLMHFILPAVVALGIAECMRKLGWIKNGDMRLSDVTK